MTCFLQTSLPRTKFICLLGFLISQLFNLQAQQRCGIVEYTNRLRSKNILRESDAQFEQWLNEKIKNRTQSTDPSGRTQSTSYQIPIVVHIVHNGEPIGTGANISDAQILSQIKVLNDDYKRLNADAVNTPSEFLSAAGSMDIEFVLAKQAPDGSVSNGIVRVNGSKASWLSTEDTQLKALGSYWPTEDYFNVWVCNLTGYLGYTQFPVSTLPGLDNNDTQGASTDGVVITHQCFGTTDAGSFTLLSRYDKGRTLTHETGHFLGLRHTWGDASGCNGTDYVGDTPNQNGNTNGCPSNPASNGCTPTAHKMFQNYLDYTDDVCMNVFTAGQISRMSTVLENSIRRKTLLNSHGLIDPTTYADDLGILEVVSPSANECDGGSITPTISVRNYGSNSVTSASIQLLINSVVVETKNLTLSLSKFQSSTVTFAPVLQSDGSFTFQFNIVSTNNTTDGNVLNNKAKITSLFSTAITTPFNQSFETSPSNWVTQNPDKLKTWERETAPFSTTSNKAMYLNYFDYKENTGTLDMLTSAPFNLTGARAFLSFDVAYAMFQNTSNDKLQVLILSDCNTDMNFGTELYTKSGTTLSTATATSLSFKPKNENDWRKELIDISDYIGQNNLRVMFVGTNDYGNNIYIDNVSIITSSYIDLAITNIKNPSFVSCSEPKPKIVVQNIGTQDIVNFTVQSKVNSNQAVNTSINVLLKSGQSSEVDLPALTLADGSNTVLFTISNPNGIGTDINPVNNSKSVTVIANPVSKTIPLRENFDSGFDDGWFSINPSNGMKWNLKDGTNYKASAYFNAFDNTTINDEAWLISPQLDFSHTTKASVFFDQSYAQDSSKTTSEELRIFASIGCGNAFSQLLYDSSAAKLSNTSSTSSWTPIEADDWRREFLNLDSLVGKKDVRLAFVVTNGNGNNIYLDNIEFYTYTDSPPLPIENNFAIYSKQNDPADFYITFNLTEQQDASLDVFDVMGRAVLSNTLTYTLNQTYAVSLPDATTGVYIVHLRAGQNHYAQKILINK